VQKELSMEAKENKNKGSRGGIGFGKQSPGNGASQNVQPPWRSATGEGQTTGFSVSPGGDGA